MPVLSAGKFRLKPPFLFIYCLALLVCLTLTPPRLEALSSTCWPWNNTTFSNKHKGRKKHITRTPVDNCMNDDRHVVQLQVNTFCPDRCTCGSIWFYLYELCQPGFWRTARARYEISHGTVSLYENWMIQRTRLRQGSIQSFKSQKLADGENNDDVSLIHSYAESVRLYLCCVEIERECP